MRNDVRCVADSEHFAKVVHWFHRTHCAVNPDCNANTSKGVLLCNTMVKLASPGIDPAASCLLVCHCVNKPIFQMTRADRQHEKMQLASLAGIVVSPVCASCSIPNEPQQFLRKAPPHYLLDPCILVMHGTHACCSYLNPHACYSCLLLMPLNHACDSCKCIQQRLIQIGRVAALLKVQASCDHCPSS